MTDPAPPAAMAVDPHLFPIPYGPTFPVEREKAPRLNISSYGDGYEQRSGDGINIIRPTPEIAWSGGLTREEAMEADAFLTKPAAQVAFRWAYPGDVDDDGDPLPTWWIATKWKPSFVGPGNWAFTMSLKQDFNPPPASPV